MKFFKFPSEPAQLPFYNAPSPLSVSSLPLSLHHIQPPSFFFLVGHLTYFLELFRCIQAQRYYSGEGQWCVYGHRSFRTATCGRLYVEFEERGTFYCPNSTEYGFAPQYGLSGQHLREKRLEPSYLER
ncbi:hypothetical protein PROFUN_13005 [Planoprotostelium fungivorum]|uniref:Uncharacterized protein n=1 Tax=Planoprotostelium fungivorum TaxID=1890364 RepID=A0A2P6N5T2_9EUKA|nr:hypothetical protein PROFUN_13005 [Planoprotostelium fungivorum]